MAYLAQDARFTLDQLAAQDQADPNGILTGRLDLERAGLFGISLGGIVGAEACQLEPRLRACLVMDAPIHALVERRRPLDLYHSALEVRVNCRDALSS